MIKAYTICLVVWIALASLVYGESPEWVLKADYVDACSCDIPCPCIFGSPSTHGFCRGATLLEITEGHYGEIDFTGVTVLAVYDAGHWFKFFVSENATQEQVDAVPAFLATAEGFFKGPVLEVKRVPISVERTDGRVKIATEGTLIELEQVKGLSGDPIKISGLPGEGFPGLPYIDHTQYKAIVLSHKGGAEEFSFSGSNGYTARVEATSADSAKE